MDKIMDFIRRNIFYRNLPVIETEQRVHAVKQQIAKQASQTQGKIVELNTAIDKSKTYYIAKGMGGIK